MNLSDQDPSLENVDEPQPQQDKKDLRQLYFFLILNWVSILSIRGTNQLIIQEFADRYWPPITFMTLRNLVALFFLTPIVWYTYRKNKEFASSVRNHVLAKSQFWKVVGKLSILGIFESQLSFILYAYGEKKIPSESASIILASNPIITILFVNMFYLKNMTKLPPTSKITKLRSLGMFLGLLGVGLISVSDFISSKQASSDIQSAIGYSLYFGGVVAASFALAFWGKFKGKVHWLIASWGRCFFGLIYGSMASLLVDFQFPPGGMAHHYEFFASMREWRAIFGLLWMGILSGVIGVINVYYLTEKVDATLAQTPNFVVPAVGLVEGIARGHWKHVAALEKILEVVGALVVVVGLVCTVGKPRIKRRKIEHSVLIEHPEREKNGEEHSHT